MPGRLVQADLSWLFCPEYPVLKVLSWLSRHRCPFSVALSSFPVLAVILPPYLFPVLAVLSDCPVPAVLSQLSSPSILVPSYPVAAVLSCCHVLPALFAICCLANLLRPIFQADMSRLTCPDCPIPVALSQVSTKKIAL
jgi:hypothetical protein